MALLTANTPRNFRLHKIVYTQASGNQIATIVKVSTVRQKILETALMAWEMKEICGIHQSSSV